MVLSKNKLPGAGRRGAGVYTVTIPGTVQYSTVKITGFKILFANISPLSPSVLYPVSCGAHSRFQREETTAWGARVRVRARAAWACRGRDGATAAPGGGEQKEHLPGTMRV